MEDPSICESSAALVPPPFHETLGTLSWEVRNLLKINNCYLFLLIQPTMKAMTNGMDCFAVVGSSEQKKIFTVSAG